MSDELDFWLSAARPDTAADAVGGWADSPAGRRALAAVRRRVRTRSAGRRTARAPRHELRLSAVLGAGLTAAAAVVVTLAAFAGGAARDPGSAGGSGAGAFAGARPADMALAAFDSCSAALTGLRDHTADALAAGTFRPAYGYAYSAGAAYGNVDRGPLADRQGYAALSSGKVVSAPTYSTTNTQEVGVGEPDVVETDGSRVVSVSGGVLRVSDAASRTVIGTLDLTAYAGASTAQLLMDGNRVLVLLGGSTGYAQTYYGPVYYGGISGPDVGSTATSTVLLVDIAHAPRIVSMLHTRGSYVDARMVHNEVRLVVRSTPSVPVTNAPRKSAAAAFYQSSVANLPISTWLPTYEITTGGSTTTRTVPCTALRHPRSYSGASMITVYSFGLADGFGDAAPLTVAGDGSTVYASATSLYVAAPDGTSTVLHRFDITRPGRPTYLGSGHVAGRLRDAYSLSDYQGSLRVVTTAVSGKSTSSTLSVLDADTLRRTGTVGGLGDGQQVQAVRFAGAYGYVVTFRQVDPLYVLDLRDPAHPREAGALEVSGYSSYLHPTDPGRLLGVGQDVVSNRVAGLQVSLFDVSDPADPQRVANVVRPKTAGEAGVDPHAFLYWAPTRTAVVPVQTWQSTANGTVLVLHVGTDSLQVRGTIRNPSGAIARTLVVGGTLWTMSSGGLAVSDLDSLHRLAWIPFG